MSVSVLSVICVEEAANEAVCSALRVHHFKILSVPDDHTHLVVLFWLLGNVPNGAILLVSELIVDLSPHDDGALRHFRARV